MQSKMQSKNYIIDGDADGVIEGDFFAQLKNMLNHSEPDEHEDCDNNDNTKNEDEDNCCLLTKERLQNIHIVLECGHKFNYIPLYREVIAQKTIGLSFNGYYTSHSLKRNQIKCPYCRNVQDKLLPYLEFDGVKKTFNVNYPAKMSMTSQPCMHSVNLNSKKSKKNTSCQECAIEYYNGTYVCKKHYEHELSITTHVEHVNAKTNANTTLSSPTSALSPSKCGVILRYGKNKGNPCPNPSSCRIHSSHKNNQTNNQTTDLS
jgi:hypothetical protein